MLRFAISTHNWSTWSRIWCPLPQLVQITRGTWFQAMLGLTRQDRIWRSEDHSLRVRRRGYLLQVLLVFVLFHFEEIPFLHRSSQWPGPQRLWSHHVCRLAKLEPESNIPHRIRLLTSRLGDMRKSVFRVWHPEEEPQNFYVSALIYIADHCPLFKRGLVVSLNTVSVDSVGALEKVNIPEGTTTNMHVSEHMVISQHFLNMID